MIHYKSMAYKHSVFLCENQNAWQKEKTATDLALIFELLHRPQTCH